MSFYEQFICQKLKGSLDSFCVMPNHAGGALGLTDEELFSSSTKSSNTAWGG